MKNVQRAACGRCAASGVRALLLFVLSLIVQTAWALLPPGSEWRVVYSPNVVQDVNIEQPTTWSYDLDLKSPSALSEGNYPVEVEIDVVSAPPGITLEAARALVSVSQVPPFSGPSQSQKVTVTVQAPTGSPSGDYQYFLYTKGWPASVTDKGTYINTHVSPPSGLPAPVLGIASPADGAKFSHQPGGSDVPVAIVIEARGAPSAEILTLAGSVSAVDAAGKTIVPATGLTLVPTGLGSESCRGEMTLPVSAAGTYTLTARATSNGGTTTVTSTFVVNEAAPPTVALTESPKASYDYYLGTPALAVPFAFRATSSSGGIRGLSAALDGTPVGIVSSGLGAAVATATGSLSVASAGTHVLEVTATDDNGTASALASFVVNVIALPTEFAVRGTVFFDLNWNGVRDPADYGLPGISVKLTRCNGQSTTVKTDADGAYQFNVPAGSYRVAACLPCGFCRTTPNIRGIKVKNAAVTVPDIGFGLSFFQMMFIRADGHTIGYWKTNLDKALAGKTKGVQVSASALKGYTNSLSTLALEPFDGLTMPQAVSYLASTSCKPKDLLAKQLVAAEYNYASGALIGDSGTLTYAFIYYCEYVQKNASSLSNAYVLWVKDWCESYNKSDGCWMLGPIGAWGFDSDACHDWSDCD